MRSCAVIFGLLGTALILGGVTTSARSGAVDDFREALRGPADDLAERGRELRVCAARLQNLSELSAVLLLADWRDDEIDLQLAALDRNIWRSVYAQFEKRIRQDLQGNDATAKLRALAMLGETGETACGSGRRTDVVGAFAPDLIRLTKESEPRVVEASARALGRIRPDPQVAIPALKQLLDADDAGQRLAAAEGLFYLMNQASLLARKGQSTNRADVLRAEAGVMGSLIVPVAVRGLTDPEAEVRRACVEALREAATMADALIADPRLPVEADDWPFYRREVESERGALGSVVFTLQVHGPALGRMLADSNSEVRRFARETLESLAHARQRLVARADSIAAPSSPGNEKPILANTKAKTPGESMPVAALAKAVGDRDPKARLAAIDILEALGPTAAPAGPALVKALGDSNRFVRWAAARAIGKIGPVEAERAVPILAKMLADKDVELRKAAATTLACYGQAARPALPSLIGVLGDDNTALRVAALRALETIGLDAQPAIPAIRDALDDRDACVRQSAARLLGKLGPSARDALDSLRNRLKDNSLEVRTAAHEALLKIGQ